MRVAGLNCAGSSASVLMRLSLSQTTFRCDHKWAPFTWPKSMSAKGVSPCRGIKTCRRATVTSVPKCMAAPSIRVNALICGLSPAIHAACPKSLRTLGLGIVAPRFSRSRHFCPGCSARALVVPMVPPGHLGYSTGGSRLRTVARAASLALCARPAETQVTVVNGAQHYAQALLLSAAHR